MVRPSIDRIDNDGDYTFANCRYIPYTENADKGRHVKRRKWTWKKNG
jgi:hypothetical protein